MPDKAARARAVLATLDAAADDDHLTTIDLLVLAVVAVRQVRGLAAGRALDAARGAGDELAPVDRLVLVLVALAFDTGAEVTSDDVGAIARRAHASADVVRGALQRLVEHGLLRWAPEPGGA